MTTILIVEDNELNRTMLRRRLGQRGYHVLTADAGAEGVALARTALPDVILMDLELGAMDGWQATRLLREDERTAAIPIIAVTGKARDADRQRAIEFGFDEFEVKPVDIDRLVSKIRQQRGVA